MDFSGKLHETISNREIKGICGHPFDKAIFRGFLEKKKSFQVWSRGECVPDFKFTLVHWFMTGRNDLKF